MENAILSRATKEILSPKRLRRPPTKIRPKREVIIEFWKEHGYGKWIPNKEWPIERIYEELERRGARFAGGIKNLHSTLLHLCYTGYSRMKRRNDNEGGKKRASGKWVRYTYCTDKD